MSAAPGDWTRREFLNAAAGAGGTVLLAWTLPGLGGAGKQEPAQLNAWLTIAADNSCTVIVDRSEMGQGVYTALPMLLAEELEIEVPNLFDALHPRLRAVLVHHYTPQPR